MWVCRKCFHNNDRNDAVCASCGTARIVDNRPQNPVLAPPSCQKCNSPLDPNIRHCLKCKKAELKPFVGPVPRDFVKKDTKEDLRLVLIGRTGGGKSATANTIIDKENFASKRSLASVTKICEYVCAERFGRMVQLVDTPGLLDTNMKKDVVETEIKKSIGVSSPGPHAFLLVTTLTQRFTDEEEKVFKEIEGMFGKGMTRHLIVVFTCRDQITPNTEVSELLLEAPECLKQLIESAGGGYLCFNNKGTNEEKETDVKALFSRIDEMMATNKTPFSSTMYQQGEGLMKETINSRQREEYENIYEDVVQEQLKEDVEEKMKREKEFCQELLKAAPQDVEAMKKEREAIRQERQTDADTENTLADMLEKEAKILVKTEETKQQIQNAKGEERMRMHIELARDEENITKIKAEREQAEDRVKKERLIYLKALVEQFIREQEREKIQNGDISTLHTLMAAIKIIPHFLNLFQES
ncbi:GTPase IMAP family member 7-like [Haliotis rubra]|uniref:GTPase IMAP family member 7-like n=1 Tax=Haliotis rubra TaxID=36100 RepID=UPI001EE570AF|nr:GTPase IMAP family member 7-like [Haliotis rubra]